jgi:hypothetical protein
LSQVTISHASNNVFGRQGRDFGGCEYRTEADERDGGCDAGRRDEKAKEINIRLFLLFEAMFLETNPIPVKRAAEMMGLTHRARPASAGRVE